MSKLGSDARVAHLAAIVAAFSLAMLAGERASAQQNVELDFDEALELARQNAPQLRTSRADVAVAEAGVEAARFWRRNPSVSVASGPRIGDETSIDVIVSAKQPIALGGRVDARRQVTDARVDVAQLTVADHERRVVAEAARAFARLGYWQHRLELAARHVELLTEIATVAERRKDAGDVGALDPSVAKLAVSRAQNDVARAEAARLDAQSKLAWLLGSDDGTELKVDSDLQSVGRRAAGPPEDGTRERSDIALAHARVEVARARQHLATRDRVPVFALGAAGGREEGAAIVRGIFEITLPFFWRGQGELLEATAQEEASLEHAAVTAARAEREVRVARRKIAVLDEAVAQFTAEGLTTAERTAEIAAASYRAGAIPLPELLVVRRELVAAEREFAELLLLAALARIEYLASSGAFDSDPNTDAQEKQ